MLDLAARSLAMVAIIIVGWGLKRVGLLHKRDFRVLSNLVLYVTLPCALLTAFNGHELDPALLGVTLLSAVLNVIQIVIGYVAERRRGRRAQAFGALNSGSYNVGAFATPYLAGMLGPQAMIPTTMFDIGAAFTSVGVGYGWSMGLVEDPPQPGRGRRVLMHILKAPIMVIYPLLVVLALTHITLPDAIITFTGTVGAANPFVAMAMVGVGLELRLPRHQIQTAARLLALRYGFAILAAVGVWFLLPMAADIRAIVIMLLFAPMAAMIAAFTGKAGLDFEVSAFMTSVTILVAIITMPVILVVLG